MGFNGRARIGAAGLLVGGLAALTASGALADANNKARDGYDAEASSSGGISLTDDLGSVGDVDLAELAPRTVAIGSTSSSSNTDRAGSDGHASASALTVLGTSPGGEAKCDAVGDPESGSVKSSDEAGLLTLGDGTPVRVDLLPASCDAMAVKSNNASGHAYSALAVVEVNDVASVELLASESSNKTTSGQSHSESSFTVVSAEVANTDVNVVQCTSSSKDTNGTESHSSSLSPVNGVPLLVECPLAESNATYKK